MEALATSPNSGIVEKLQQQFSANRVLFNKQVIDPAARLNTQYVVSHKRILLLKSQPMAQLEVLLRSMVNQSRMGRKAGQEDEWEDDDYDAGYDYHDDFNEDEGQEHGIYDQVEVDLPRQAADYNDDDQDEIDIGNKGSDNQQSLENYYSSVREDYSNHNNDPADYEQRDSYESNDNNAGSYEPADNSYGGGNDDDWEDED